MNRIASNRHLFNRPTWRLCMKLEKAIVRSFNKNVPFGSNNDRLFCQMNKICRQYLYLTSYRNSFQLSNHLLKYSQSNKGSSENKSSSSGKEGEGENKEDPNKKNGITVRDLMIPIALMFIAQFLFSVNDPNQASNISWQYFVNHVLTSGEVEKITVLAESNVAFIFLHPGAIIEGKPVRSNLLSLKISSVPSFEEKLRQAEKSLGVTAENSISIQYERSYDSLIRLLLIIGFVSLLIYSFANVSKGAGKSLDLFGGLRSAKFTMIDPSLGQGKGVKFSDVAGLKEAKVEIMEFVAYLKNAERYKNLGAKIPKGVLLLGPPGCGKTLLAKAVASEASVPFLAMAGSEFIEMIGGLGAARVRDLFAKARLRSPCIIYIDEIDAIGRKRSSNAVGSSSDEGEQTLNQLLVEMDGMAGREGIILLASTNRAEILDKALLRPGRFDRHILIDYPTLAERVEIFQHHLKPIKLEKEPSAYASRLAQLTPGFSGADIANVCNEAALNAAKTLKRHVTEVDLEYAIERIVGGAEKRTTVISPDERKIVAYHESGHALVGWLLKHTDALLKITIVPRTSAVLGFAMNLPTDKKLYSQEELFDKMCMALGGRVAESVVFNKVTTGAQNDLKKVTNMAYTQVKSFGMDPVVGPLSFGTSNELGEASSDYSAKPYSKKLAATIDTRVSMLVGSAYKATEKVILENRDKLKILADALLERETLNYNDVVKLIGPPPHGNKKQVEIIDFGPVTEEETKQQQQQSNESSNEKE